MIRDTVVYDHRILQPIPMGHGRETTFSLSLKTVCILMFNMICIYITGHRSIWYSNLNCAAYRDASREGEGEGEKGEKNVYHIFHDLEYESLQGVSSYCANCLPCDTGSEVAWTTTALQQPLRIYRVLYFHRRNFTAQNIV